MNVVFIVPTGIGAEIGGHSGDATPAAKLIASTCDKLFIHPNVVNASDINEMTSNMLYVEGSILDRFLEGRLGLQETHGNRILLVVNQLRPEIVNAVSAARATIGANIEILELQNPLRMSAYVNTSGLACGTLPNFNEVVDEIRPYSRDYDVLVINTPIETSDSSILDYLSSDGGTNIWGYVEAKLSREMTRYLDRPVFHAPVENSEVFRNFNDVVDPRKSAELVSVCYLHCCLKGAHLAPRMSQTFKHTGSYSRSDIDFMVTPAGAYGRPHAACLEARIPVIVVEENKTVLNDRMPGSFILAKNYLEAAGIIAAKKAGVSLESVRRPLKRTKLL